jgi:GAF domain-containing protein
MLARSFDTVPARRPGEQNDVPEQSREEHERDTELLEGQQRVLALINEDVELPVVLEEICRVIETQADGMLTSVLLVDADGEHLRHGAAPSLPADYCEAVDGISIGEGVGSCGHAAATGEPFAVDNIPDHPNWVAFRTLAHDEHGLTSCWSTPITSWDGRVVATFAMYYREARRPGLQDRRLADLSAHLVGIAIERATERERLQQS